LTKRLNILGHWIKNQANTTDEKRLSNYKFTKWALDYFMSHTTEDTVEYFKNNINDFDIIYMLDIENSTSDYAYASADVIADLLINQQNSTLDNLNLNWPNLESLKQKIKQSISYGIYSTAKCARNYLYLPMQKLGTKYPSTVYWSNKAIDKIRTEAVTPLVNFNTNKMQWADLFNIWLFELTPGHFSNNTINFTNSSNIIKGNNIYNPATNAVKNFQKGNTSGTLLNIKNHLANGLGINQTVSGYFKYDVNAFYSTLSNLNIGIQMLGSFPIEAKVLSKSGNTALVQFTITNILGWESETRFIKGENGGGNQGVIPNKPVGSGLHLGGTITNNFVWTETIIF